MTLKHSDSPSRNRELAKNLVDLAQKHGVLAIHGLQEAILNAASALVASETAKHGELVTRILHFLSQSAPHHRSREWYKMLDDAQHALAGHATKPHPDTERLDFIERMGRNSNWVARHSVTGRGYRLHNDAKGTALSARNAIDEAMRTSGERGPV